MSSNFFVHKGNSQAYNTLFALVTGNVEEWAPLYIVQGPAGAGKSTVLREAQRWCEPKYNSEMFEADSFVSELVVAYEKKDRNKLEEFLSHDILFVDNVGWMCDEFERALFKFMRAVRKTGGIVILGVDMPEISDDMYWFLNSWNTGTLTVLPPERDDIEDYIGERMEFFDIPYTYSLLNTIAEYCDGSFKKANSLLFYLSSYMLSGGKKVSEVLGILSSGNPENTHNAKFKPMERYEFFLFAAKVDVMTFAEKLEERERLLGLQTEFYSDMKQYADYKEIGWDFSLKLAYLNKSIHRFVRLVNETAGELISDADSFELNF